MKKILKLSAVLLLIITSAFFINYLRDDQRYSTLQTKLGEFRQNKNYNLALRAFNDTLPALMKGYTFEMSPKDSYSNRRLLSTGPVLFNLMYDKCAVLFALETEGYQGKKRIQEFYCYGDLKEKWIFYNSLWGLHGMEMSDNAAEKELKQALNQLIDDFQIITRDQRYNDHFVNCHNKGFGDPRL